MRVRTFQGGGAVAYAQPAKSIYVLDANGNAAPPVQVPLLSREAFVQPRRLSGNHLWMMINGKHFVRFDLRADSHKVLMEFPDGGWPSLRSAEEGIYFTDRGKIQVLGWDGKTRVVRSAYLQ